jgi:hypothetical protein
MSILMSMPTMHHLPHFDPFNSQAYSTPMFDSQEHYFQPAAAYSPTGYATTTTHQFPVDPRWFNTSLSGHASAAPLQFSTLTLSDISPPHSQTDVLSLSPSSTIAPIPLSGSRNRSRSMSNRIRSFNQATRLPRPSAASATRAGPTNTTHQRIIRRSTVSSPSAAHLQPGLQSPTGLPPPPPYAQSPTLHTQDDGHETRAAKRRRTNDHDSSHLQSFSVVPEPPLLLTQAQQPHLAQLHAHGYSPAQTWAGPPSADHIVHGVGPDQHGFTQWPVVPMAYFTHDPNDSHLGDAADAANASMIPYPSPTMARPALYASPASPELETPMSAVSATYPMVRKFEAESPRLEEEFSTEPFEHGPTEFPPKPYSGGADAKSPWTYVKPTGKIYGSRLEQMPAIEARLANLEVKMDQYLDVRSAHALKNSQLPGLEFDAPIMEFKPLGPCRMFGGRIWPTALARRVRRTPRD